jgi:hypothetical protein
MTADDICPGLSDQPLDVQLREVLVRARADVELLQMTAGKEWRRHDKDRLEKLHDRLELAQDLISAGVAA